MRVLHLFLSLVLLTTTCFGQYLKPLPGMPFVNRTRRLGRGLVAYYPFNERSGPTIFDLSGNGNTGTLVGTPDWVSGPFGSALDFDGAGDYVSVGDKPSLDFGTGNFSVSILIKTSGDTISIIGKQDTNSGWYLYLDTDEKAGIVNFYHRKDALYTLGITPLNDNKLHHIIFVRDGAAGYLYVDGQDDTLSTDDISGTVDSAGDVFEIGRRMVGGTDDRYFDGLIDLPMVWNRALSASERAEIFRNPLGMLQKDNTALIASVEAPPPTGGQVIMITSAIPVILILAICLTIGRIKHEPTQES